MVLGRNMEGWLDECKGEGEGEREREADAERGSNKGRGEINKEELNYIRCCLRSGFRVLQVDILE